MVPQTLQKSWLSATDIRAIVQKAQALIDAHQRRNPDAKHPTISERDTLESLVRNIESLVRNRRDF